MDARTRARYQNRLMGSDYSVNEVQDVCPSTGWPRDEYGIILNADEGPEDGWKTDWRGLKLPVLTDPYGVLHFAIGSEDDFICFDYSIIKGIGLNRGQWLVLHAVVNSETGGFIDRFDYQITPLMDYDHDEITLTRKALDWCAENDLKHDKSGWNQDPFYFARCVYLEYLRSDTVRDVAFDKVFSDRQKRFGGKRIGKICNLAKP